MYTHHADTIKIVAEMFQKREDVLALLITGSIAHGLEKENSDVDIMIIVSDEDYKARLATGDISYFNNECCTYMDGYVDGKYICIDFMKKVAEKGSEPARFAFEGVKIAFSKIDGLQELLDSIARYPVEKKAENIRRFYSQLEAWRWYFYEAKKHKNEYLLNLAITNIVLFGGRMVLAHNELLYPYHKWFLRILSKAGKKPGDIIALIDEIYASKDGECIEKFYQAVMNLTDWGVSDVIWPSQFAVDSELNWLDGMTPVADI